MVVVAADLLLPVNVEAGGELLPLLPPVPRHRPARRLRVDILDHGGGPVDPPVGALGLLHQHLWCAVVAADLHADGLFCLMNPCEERKGDAASAKLPMKRL